MSERPPLPDALRAPESWRNEEPTDPGAGPPLGGPTSTGAPCPICSSDLASTDDGAAGLLAGYVAGVGQAVLGVDPAIGRIFFLAGAQAEAQAHAQALVPLLYAAQHQGVLQATLCPGHAFRAIRIATTKVEIRSNPSPSEETRTQ